MVQHRAAVQVGLRAVAIDQIRLERGDEAVKAWALDREAELVVHHPRHLHAASRDCVGPVADGLGVEDSAATASRSATVSSHRPSPAPARRSAAWCDSRPSSSASPPRARAAGWRSTAAWLPTPAVTAPGGAHHQDHGPPRRRQRRRPPSRNRAVPLGSRRPPPTPAQGRAHRHGPVEQTVRVRIARGRIQGKVRPPHPGARVVLQRSNEQSQDEEGGRRWLGHG